MNPCVTPLPDIPDDLPSAQINLAPFPGGSLSPCQTRPLSAGAIRQFDASPTPFSTDDVTRPQSAATTRAGQ